MSKRGNYDRLLFENTVIGLALCRMNGDLVDVNTAYASLIGRSIEETLTLSYWEITPDKYAPQESMQLKSIEETGKYGPYEKEYFHKSGKLVPVRLSGQLVDIDGEEYIWSSVEDISDRKQAEEDLARLYKEVEKLSLQDGLTGIANRRMIDQSLDKEWSRSLRNKSPLSLIMLDIDYFKQFNDNYGHLQGDECLIKIAKTLSQVTKREIDLIGRYGGEEFLVLLPETNEKQAIQFAQKCINAIKQLKIPHKNSKIDKMLTVSAGVSTTIPTQDSEAADLILEADKLLYCAKQNGRNRVEFKAK